MARLSLFAWVATGAISATFATAADTNVALHKPVTGTSFYSSGTETFPYANVTDGLLNDTGAPSAWSFWITPNGQTGSFTIDLLGNFTIDSFDLQNTHNRGFNDRGTTRFRISLSEDGTTFGAPVLDSPLATVFNTGNSIPIDHFDIAPADARYVKFDMVSFQGNSGGLNELEVNAHPSAVPEPASLGLLAVAAPILLRRKRR